MKAAGGRWFGIPVSSDQRRASASLPFAPLMDEGPHTKAPATTHAARVKAAYDGLASDYDDHLSRDMWIRRVLWRHFDRLFHAGDHVVDGGCGTGSDTIHLAGRGINVTAIDVSPKMLEQLRAKLAPLSFASLVDVRAGELNQIAAALPHTFDGVISSFAALNTVDLATFGATAASLLRPGGRLVCHMLSPGYLSRGMRALFAPGRRELPAASGATQINVGGEPLHHLVLTPTETYQRFFSAGFVLRRCYALGFLIPRRVETHVPAAVLKTAGLVEGVLGAMPSLVARGRFFVLELERRGS